MSASDNKDAIDFKLALFVKMVRDGRTPPQDLLNLVADGVDVFRSNGKPWAVKTGRKQRLETNEGHVKATKAYVLRCIRLRHDQIAHYLSVHTKTAQRLINEGKIVKATEQYIGLFNLELACSELLANKHIIPSHKDKIKKALEFQRKKKEADEVEARSILLSQAEVEAQGQDIN